MLNLNDEKIKSEGSSFDTSKIFGFEVVEKVNGVDTITKSASNVVIVGFNQGVAANGSKFWDLQIKDSKGNENNIREYDVDMTRSDSQKKIDSQLKRLKHILSKFVPEGLALPQAQTFPEMWTAIEQLLKQYQANTKPLRVKLVYNDKGYLTIPKYVPFMELMSVPVEQSKLKLDPNFDSIVRPSADNAAEAMTQVDAVDDVPFSF